MTVSRDFSGWLRQPVRIQQLLRWLLVLFFLWLAGRFWHPYYGFTRFIQLDDTDAAVLLPELRNTPIYVYHYSGGYDGVAYAQLAVRPAARGPELARAVDSLPYRARRILLSWTAYAIGLGDPARIVQVYAALNLAVWLALAALLVKIFPPGDWRNLIAWAGLLFSAGALHSVRLALTDLAALTLLAGAMVLAGRRKDTAAATLLGAAGLVRETALLGVISLVPADWRQHRGVTVARLALAGLPLVAWLLYLKKFTGPVVNGLGNIGWPLVGWLGKFSSAVQQLGREPDTWLAMTTLLAWGALTVQFIYVVLRPEPRDPWWRLGAMFGTSMLFLSPAVWVGHPGAATRILLPLSLAFNVLAMRRRAAVAWLIVGNMTVASGVLALWQVPHDEHEVAAGRAAAGGYVVHTDARWYQTERNGDQTWAWCSAQGGVDIDLWPRLTGSVGVRLTLHGFTARPLDIRQEDRTLWRGTVEDKLQRIELPAVALVQGRARLQLSSAAPPIKESGAAGARELGFALYRVEVK